ncbi:MAG: di-heme oxidoredictase family protein [Gammaproteobacteria bacterium]
MKHFIKGLLLGGVLSLFAAAVLAEVIGSGPRLKPEDRVSQDQIVSGSLDLVEIRKAGLMVFTTPFNKADGYGDGLYDGSGLDNRDPAMGNRPSLQAGHAFLRVNGLDSQTCLECHSVVSNATVPAQFGVGGVGTLNNTALFQPSIIDVADRDLDGIAEFNGRVINPPFLFGSGGVELLAREMTADLQSLREQARAEPGAALALVTKGVAFGEIIANQSGEIDTSGLEGIDADLVVRPFGRKGDMASVREFAVGALSFHLGMQAAEVFEKEYEDPDNDGVANEISIGDLSALSIFLTTMERPRQQKAGRNERRGFALFKKIGCADCHRPVLTSSSRYLQYKLTGAAQQPFEDTFYSVDLTRKPMRFQRAAGGGVRIGLFSDLKRHDMGEGLSESFDKATDEQNRQYITARLWGIADSAPYLHDGRALTLNDAIELHDSTGSEAAPAAQAFMALDDDDKNRLLSFLLTLRTPRKPNADVVGH